MRRTTRATLCVAAAAATAVATMALPMTTASARPAGPRDTMRAYAADTYRSMEAMVDPRTGLVSDNIQGSLAADSRAGYTSPTNIGAYLWSTVAARELGLLSGKQAHQRLKRTLDAIGRLERHRDSGMFYNWYSPADGSKLRIWPEEPHNAVEPFLSSVDNGWMAAALMVTRSADRSLAGEANALLAPMDFGFFFDPAAPNSGGAGLIRGGFWDEKPSGCSVEGNLRQRGPNVFYTCHYYGNFVSEPRIASYIGIARGQIPATHYFGPARTFPATCDWSWQEQKPVGETKTYLGVDVFEGAYQYRGLQLVPTWGGDMFEALMPDLFVPEASWGARSFGINHPLTVEAQIKHGLDEAGYGYWGFSPASNPAGGYREYGVDEIGLDTNGYTSDQERTSVDRGYEGCPERVAQPQPTFGDGVVTPHAAFLALPYKQGAALANLAKLRRNFDAYGRGGFYDAVAVKSETVAKRYLSLDQGMIMGALGNVLGDGVLHRDFTRGEVTDVLKPVMGLEEFNARRLP
jgi:putative glucoamylase/uncharacterized protein DUF3131